MDRIGQDRIGELKYIKYQFPFDFFSPTRFMETQAYLEILQLCLKKHSFFNL